jgi:membrane associated rhomboid family serine protease
LAALAAYEVYGFLSPLKKKDHAAHLGGLAVGLATAQLYYDQEKQNGSTKEKKRLRWYEIVLGRNSDSGK